MYGLAKKRPVKPSLEELIHHHQVTGQFQDALACYERLGKDRRYSTELKSGMLRCYLEMDQPHSTSMLVKGFMEQDPETKDELMKYQIESAWQLGRWDEIEVKREECEKPDWAVNLGELLLCVQKQNMSGNAFDKHSSNCQIKYHHD